MRTRPVSCPVTVMLTPGSGLPSGSVATPWRFPEVACVCAHALEVNDTARRIAKAKISTQRAGSTFASQSEERRTRMRSPDHVAPARVGHPLTLSTTTLEACHLSPTNLRPGGGGRISSHTIRTASTRQRLMLCAYAPVSRQKEPVRTARLAVFSWRLVARYRVSATAASI